jgi:hypothetical protein
MAGMQGKGLPGQDDVVAPCRAACLSTNIGVMPERETTRKLVTMFSEEFVRAELQYRQRRFLHEANTDRLARQARCGGRVEQTRIGLVEAHMPAWPHRRNNRQADADAGDTTERAA